MVMQSKKALAVFLSGLRTFEQPNPRLEQYSTDGEIAAGMLWDAHMRGDIMGKTIVDFGSGTGILGIGALALGASHVTFVELDSHVFPALMENLARLEEQMDSRMSNYEIIEGNVLEHSYHADVVLQNPPFGARDAHADIAFLGKALSSAPVVYTMHKTSTMSYLRTWLAQRKSRIASETDVSFPLKNTLSEHTRKTHRIEVTVLRILS